MTGKGGRPKKASTLEIDRGRIARHIKPLLGKRPVKDIAPADISKWLRDVSSGKTATVEKTDALRGKAIVEGGPGTAARTAGLLGGILTFAIGEGIIVSNPVRGVKRPVGKRRTRRLSPDEFARLGAALDAAEADGVAWQGIAAIRLLALTGARLSEIVEMKWSELDTPGSALRLDDSKEGASARPAGSAVFSVIGKLPRADHDYVLPAVRQGSGAYGNMPRIWKDIRERADLEGVTAHTLRHTFGSVAGDLGFSESTIAAMLGHAAGSVTGRYVHHLDSVLIAAADKVAGEIWNQMMARLSTSQMRD